MTDWSWVAFAYAVAYGSLAVYSASIIVRIRNARRAIGRVE